MVLLASDFDKSKYFKAADLSGEKKFRIKSVSVEEIGTENKPVLWFTNDERGLPLNLTNLRTCSGAFGDNMEAWVGKIIVIFPTMVDMRARWCRPCGCVSRRRSRRQAMVRLCRRRSRRRHRRRRTTSSMRWTGRRRSRP